MLLYGIKVKEGIIDTSQTLEQLGNRRPLEAFLSGKAGHYR